MSSKSNYNFRYGDSKTWSKSEVEVNYLQFPFKFLPLKVTLKCIIHLYIKNAYSEKHIANSHLWIQNNIQKNHLWVLKYPGDIDSSILSGLNMRVLRKDLTFLHNNNLKIFTCVSFLNKHINMNLLAFRHIHFYV